MSLQRDDAPESSRPVRILYAVLDPAATFTALLVRLAGKPATAVLRFARLTQLRAHCSGRVPTSTQFDGPVYASHGARLFLAPYCRLGRGVVFETSEDGQIRIGAHAIINTGCHIVSYAGIDIGDNVLIGEYASIRDANHGTELGELIRNQEHQSAPISIGDDVWIGRGAVILKGVTIGPGAVVAANSVVTRDVAAMAIVGGIPARLLRMRDQEKGA